VAIVEEIDPTAAVLDIPAHDLEAAVVLGHERGAPGASVELGRLARGEVRVEGVERPERDDGEPREPGSTERLGDGHQAEATFLDKLSFLLAIQLTQ
jgi:hypothetical protein